MIREPGRNGTTWERWQTPHLRSHSAPPRPHSAAVPGLLTVNPESLRLALLAEEQRQVFALLHRLRQTRR